MITYMHTYVSFMTAQVHVCALTMMNGEEEVKLFHLSSLAVDIHYSFLAGVRLRSFISCTSGL